MQTDMDNWRWWPQVLVRGSGFPASGVLRLSSEGLARKADSLTNADRESEAWQAFREEFCEATVDLAIELQSIASQDDFLRAVAWQNHRLMDSAIRPFLRWDPAKDKRNFRQRQREELIASYWQRYCVKNDTIGFFGPSGWGKLGDCVRTRFAPGERLLRSSEVYFEAWAIDRLAEVIEKVPGMSEWLMPRRLSFIKLDSNVLVEPVGCRVMLSPEQVAVLRACDGTMRTHDIAIRANLDLPVVLEILQALQGRRWISWKLELPVNPWPERDLRRFLDGVGDENARNQALQWLDSLEAARDRVQDSTNAGTLAAALTSMDELFERITGAASTRNEGRTYGARTLVYHDSSRDIGIVLGEDLAAAMRRPLTLLSRAARWYCSRLGEEARLTLRDVYRKAVAKHGGPVDVSTIWFASLRPLYRSIEASTRQIDQEFTKKWAAIVPGPAGTREVCYRYDDLLPLVDEAFAAPGLGWPEARYFCPDVMVSATDLNALHNGDFTLVLGEVHMAINTMGTNMFVTQHPDKADLISLVDEDFPEPRLLMVLPKESPPELTVRAHSGLIRDRDFLVEVTHHTVAADRPGLVLSRDVEVVEIEGTVMVRLPGGEVFELLDLYAEILTSMVASRFRLFADRPHMPRVKIDHLVVSRESWRFNPADLDFAAEKDEAARFVLTREWAATLGIPRYVFVKSNAGKKPVYVDFTSPIYVNALAKMVRRTNADERLTDKTITVVEMLPTHDDLWLTDHQGNRYTSELRLTWVDDRRLDSGARG